MLPCRTGISPLCVILCFNLFLSTLYNITFLNLVLINWTEWSTILVCIMFLIMPFFTKGNVKKTKSSKNVCLLYVLLYILCKGIDDVDLTCPVAILSLSRPAQSCLVVSYPALSCRVLPILVLSCPTYPCLVVSCPILSCRALSCPAQPCLVVSCPALSCLVLRSLVLSCPALSCRVLPSLVFCVLPSLVMSCPAQPCLSSSVLP